MDSSTNDSQSNPLDERRMSRRMFVGGLGSMALLAGLGLAGCSSSSSSDSSSSDSSSDSSTDGSSTATHTVTDGAGNAVEVPDSISTIAVDEVPIEATYTEYNGGSSEGIIAISASHLAAIDKTLLPTISPDIDNVDTSFYENGELNVETLAAIGPDLVLYNVNNDEDAQLFEQAGLYHVGFKTSGDPTETYQEWLRELEEIFQAEGKMDDLISHGTDIVSTIDNRTGSLTDDQKPRVMILFSVSQGSPRIAGVNSGSGAIDFGQYWIDHAGGYNVAQDINGVQTVTMEQIYEWDPDIIFINGAGLTTVTVDQVLNNEVDGCDFSSLAAVQNGAVYSTELGLWSWFTPNPDAPMVALWMAVRTNPDLFSDIDLNEQTRDWYERAYNYELSDDELTRIFAGKYTTSE